MSITLRGSIQAAVALLLLWATQAPLAHMDAVRVSLSQLFLSADVVIIARVDSVDERRFLLDEKTTVYEVVSAQTLSQYKGSEQFNVDFFQDGHGHAHYRPGDIAAIFLEDISENHQLYEVGIAADVKYVSSQVPNTEHRLQPGDIEDYEWVLSAYGQAPTDVATELQKPSDRIKKTLLRMLGSRSLGMVESGLLDWENLGAGITMDGEDIDYLLALTHDSSRPLNLRLSILRSMSRKGLVDADAWAYFFEQDNDEDLLLVLRSTQGNEGKVFLPHLVSLLQHPSEEVVEGAARALGHPQYTGAETALKPLLFSESQRLNYAAVSALLGINSEQAQRLLLDAETGHRNPKVRRMISARLKVKGLVQMARRGK